MVPRFTRMVASNMCVLTVREPSANKLKCCKARNVYTARERGIEMDDTEHLRNMHGVMLGMACKQGSKFTIPMAPKAYDGKLVVVGIKADTEKRQYEVEISVAMPVETVKQ